MNWNEMSAGEKIVQQAGAKLRHKVDEMMIKAQWAKEAVDWIHKRQCILGTPSGCRAAWRELKAIDLGPMEDDIKAALIEIAGRLVLEVERDE